MSSPLASDSLNRKAASLAPINIVNNVVGKAAFDASVTLEKYVASCSNAEGEVRAVPGKVKPFIRELSEVAVMSH